MEIEKNKRNTKNENDETGFEEDKDDDKVSNKPEN